MRRHLAMGEPAQAEHRGAGSIGWLILVAVLAVGFWAGAVWIAEFLIRARASSF